MTPARQANDKSNRAFDPTLRALKEAYRQLVKTRYPGLIATLQTGRDREHYLGAHGLPSGIRFKHSFFSGEISLIFEKKWADVAQAWFDENTPDDTWIVQHGSELHFRMSTDLMDPALTLIEQEETATEALDAICRLTPVAERIACLPS